MCLRLILALVLEIISIVTFEFEFILTVMHSVCIVYI